MLCYTDGVGRTARRVGDEEEQGAEGSRGNAGEDQAQLEQEATAHGGKASKEGKMTKQEAQRRRLGFYGWDKVRNCIWCGESGRCRCDHTIPPRKPVCHSLFDIKKEG